MVHSRWYEFWPSWYPSLFSSKSTPDTTSPDHLCMFLTLEWIFMIFSLRVPLKCHIVSRETCSLSSVPPEGTPSSLTRFSTLFSTLVHFPSLLWWVCCRVTILTRTKNVLRLSLSDWSHVSYPFSPYTLHRSPHSILIW